jgi:EmrB/QacA subfamily drug resistance transporter
LNAGREKRTAPYPTRILIAAVLGASLGFIGASIVNVALPTFQVELGANATDIQWIVSAYNLAIAALLLSAGAFSDRHGHLRTFRLGLTTYAVASIACALAWDPVVLIIARVFQGFAAALLVPSSLGLVNTAYPSHARGHAVGLWSSFSAVGAGMGPFVGGFLIEFTSWHYMFWINVPIVILAWWLLALEQRAIREKRPHRAFDWHGAVYSVLALGLLTFAAIETSTLGLASPIVLTLVGVALAMGVLFIRAQLGTDEALMPLDMFHSRNFCAANLVTFLAYCTIGGGFYVMMLTWIQIQGYSPLAAGAITLPFMLFTGGFAHPVGNLVRRIGPKLPLSGGTLLLGLGFTTFALAGVGTPFWSGYLPGVIITAAGIALLVAPVTTVVMGSVTLRRSGIASGINSAVARSAILLSVAVLGAIHFGQFERVATTGLEDLGLNDAARTHMQAQLINMAAAELPPHIDADTAQAIRRVVRESFMAGARIVMLISGFLSILAAIIAFLYIERPRRESLLEESA